MMMRLLIFTGWMLLLAELFAQPTLELRPFATGLDQPVAIAHAGGARLFVLERGGHIRVVEPDGTVLPEPMLDIRNRIRSNFNEQGLLGLAFHPDYATNGYVYLYYTRSSDGASRLSRFTRSSTDSLQLDPGSEQILLQYSQPFGNHNGGDLHFGPDGYLYLSSGDGGSSGDPGDRGQGGNTLLGKILRLDVDGGDPYAIPADNPFVGNANVRDEIWSLGWRNPWRFSFDRQTNEMWVADVGQNAFEEIHFEAANDGGGNYGWRCYEGDQPYNLNGCSGASNYIMPVHTYAHGPNTGRSITGGFVYRGSGFPSLQGHYVFGDYGSGNFWTLLRDPNGSVSVSYQGQLLPGGRLSAFGENAAGELFVATYNGSELRRVAVVGATASTPAAGPRIQVSPNPWQQQLRVELPPAGRQGTLQLYDLSGRLLREEAIRGRARLAWQRDDLPAGVYLLRHSAQPTLSQKLYVQ